MFILLRWPSKAVSICRSKRLSLALLIVKGLTWSVQTISNRRFLIGWANRKLYWTCLVGERRFSVPYFGLQKSNVREVDSDRVSARSK